MRLLLFMASPRRQSLAALLLLLALVLTVVGLAQAGQEQIEERDGYIIAGQLVDGQGQPVVEALVTANAPGEEEPLAETDSQEDGNWALVLEQEPQSGLNIVIKRPHFQSEVIELSTNDLAELLVTGTFGFGEITMTRKVTAGFWAATLIFAAVLAIIGFEKLHSTTAALAGISAVFLVSFIGVAFWPDLFIINFDRALTYINWEVIFLVMAMMIVIAVIEGTGIFQWTAFQAYRLSRGQARILVLILMAVTAVASALLDNFTTMLLMAPISMQIGLAIGINPLALIIPEILASNVGGISTLIGTPTNILIGAHAGLGFTDFLGQPDRWRRGRPGGDGPLCAMALSRGVAQTKWRYLADPLQDA